MLSCANISNGSGTKEFMWVGQATRSVVVSFSCKRDVTSRLRWNCSAFGSGRSPLCRLLPLSGPIVFALIATALAWNLTDVALLIAIGYGGFSANDGTAHPATSPNHCTRQLHSSDLANHQNG